MTTSNLEFILEEWIANLKNKDRSASVVESNFEEFFEALKRANASFEEAHDLMPKAIKAHLPNPGIVRNVYKNLKHQGKISDLTEKEFTDNWNKDITDKGTNSLYSVFPRPKSSIEEDEDPEPKVYGSMSIKEYKSQRRHAEQYPILDTEELERKIMSSSYNPIEDIASILNKKKDSNDTNK